MRFESRCNTDAEYNDEACLLARDVYDLTRKWKQSLLAGHECLYNSFCLPAVTACALSLVADSPAASIQHRLATQLQSESGRNTSSGVDCPQSTSGDTIKQSLLKEKTDVKTAEYWTVTKLLFR